MNTSAGTMTPPTAAAIASAACRGTRISPTSTSRLISRPTTKKKSAIRPSFTQWRSDAVTPNASLPTVSVGVPERLVGVGNRSVGQQQRGRRAKEQQADAGDARADELLERRQRQHQPPGLCRAADVGIHRRFGDALGLGDELEACRPALPRVEIRLAAEGEDGAELQLAARRANHAAVLEAGEVAAHRQQLAQDRRIGVALSRQDAPGDADAHRAANRGGLRAVFVVGIVRERPFGSGFDRDVIDVAPNPALAALERRDERMARRPEVRGGVTVARGVAAPDVSALQALPQVDPGVAELEALLTALGAVTARSGDRVEVCARSGHGHYRCKYFFT